MKKQANVTIKSTVTGTTAKTSTIIDDDKKKIHGTVFEKMEPMQYDKRNIEARHSIVTKKQYEEYLDDLPCSICGKIGGKCGCGE